MNDSEQLLLIVDDDEAYRQALARSLARQGFIVRTAASVADSLAICTASEPDFILLDLNLGGHSGLNLIQPLLELAPATRIVVLTGYASIQTAVGALKLGASQYLPKPANVADIVRALREDHIDIPELADDNRMTVRHLEWEYIQRILAEHDGNIAATARALKMHRRTLQRKLAKKRPAAAPAEAPV
jgi:two-component system, response regulator RegA